MELIPVIALRCAPVVIWCFVFLSASEHPLSRLPNSSELASLVFRYGFRRSGWLESPYAVITHMFVHAGLGHLMANSVSYVTVMVESRGLPFGGGNHVALFRSVTQEISYMIFSVVVMLVGGVTGGLSGHFLHCLHRRRQAIGQYGMGIALVERVVGSVQKIAADRQYVCGASAGVCALSGFNCAYYGRYVSGIMTMLPVIAELVDQSTQGSNWSSFFPGGEAAVGHAAHLGGFIAGCVMGYALKKCEALFAMRRGHRQQPVGGPNDWNQGGRRLGPNIEPPPAHWKEMFRFDNDQEDRAAEQQQ